MRVQDIMTTSVRSIPPNLGTAAARHTMRSARVRHLVVIEDGRVIGILSQRDLGGVRDESLPAGTVQDVMQSHVVVAAPETTIRAAANLLRGHNIGCLPVVDGKKLVGIVTTSDLLGLIGQGAEKPIERSVAWTLKGRGPRKPPVKRAKR
jgi:acetoin utilization protein AcuB